MPLPLRVVSTKRFERSYRRYVGRNQKRKDNVDAALRQLASDMNDPRLKIHALAGELSGRFACSCGYDCRIVFKVEINPVDSAREILLHHVGTHDEVY